VKPEEVEAAVNAAGMEVIDRNGVFYNVLQDRWNKSSDMDVNYMMLCSKGGRAD